MILLIIFGVLLVGGVVFAILGTFEVFKDRDSYYSEFNEVSQVGGAIVGLVGFLGLSICSIIALVNNCSNFYKNKVRIEYQERINSIENTRIALENQLSSSTLTVLEISSYNDTVREFKTQLKQEQLLLKDPWVGCLCCPVCNEFSVDVVSYIYVN